MNPLSVNQTQTSIYMISKKYVLGGWRNTKWVKRDGSSESLANENNLGTEQQNDDYKEGEKTKDTENKETKPKLTNCYFTYEDIMEAIDQLSVCSGPGPDGLHQFY